MASFYYDIASNREIWWIPRRCQQGISSATAAAAVCMCLLTEFHDLGVLLCITSKSRRCSVTAAAASPAATTASVSSTATTATPAGDAHPAAATPHVNCARSIHFLDPHFGDWSGGLAGHGPFPNHVKNDL